MLMVESLILMQIMLLLIRLKLKRKTGKTGNNDRKNIEIMVPLKNLSIFWRTLEMPLINSEMKLDLNWSEKCVTVATAVANQGAKFSITDLKFLVPDVPLSTQDNAKLLEQLKSGFKRILYWNKYQSIKLTERQNKYLDYLIYPGFQGVNRLFVLSFKDEAQRKNCKWYHLPTVEIKNYNVLIDEQNFFYQPVRNNSITFDSIWKIATGQGDDYTTGCLLDYNYLKDYCYKMVAIDLSNQQALDADPKAIRQINFTGNLAGTVGATMFCITEEAKETVLDFWQVVVKTF